MLHSPLHLIGRYLAARHTVVFTILVAMAPAALTQRAYAQEPGQLTPESLGAGRGAGVDDPIPSIKPVDPCGGTGQVGRGFALQTSIGGRLLALAADAAELGSGFQWNLLIGYKICRVTVGLNLDVSVLSPAGTSTAVTSVLLAPEIQIAMVRSADRRAELIGAISVGLGSTAGEPHLSGKLAPGIRYWLHPHIAINTLVGFTGDLVFHGKKQAALLSLFGMIGVMGAF